jgi:hypothetical protein
MVNTPRTPLTGTPRSPFASSKKKRCSLPGGHGHGKPVSKVIILRVVGAVCAIGVCLALGLGLGLGLSRKAMPAVRLPVTPETSSTLEAPTLSVPYILSTEYCNRLQSPAQSLCTTYVQSSDAYLFAAAKKWRIEDFASCGLSDRARTCPTVIAYVDVGQRKSSWCTGDSAQLVPYLHRICMQGWSFAYTQCSVQQL